MNEKKMDSRVRRTKKLLREGLAQLMLEKSVKKISVRELSDLVEINRGTFYLHYKDIFDLVKEIEDELFEEFEEIVNSHEVLYSTNSFDGYFKENVYQFIVDICLFLDKNKKMCNVLLSPNGDLDFVLRLKKFINEKCYEEFFQNKHTEPIRDKFNYAYAYFEAGAMGILGYWLKDKSPDRESPEDVAKTLEHIFLYGISYLTKEQRG